MSDLNSGFGIRPIDLRDIVESAPKFSIRQRCGRPTLGFSSEYNRQTGSGRHWRACRFRSSLLNACFERLQNGMPLRLLRVDESVDFVWRHRINVGTPKCELFRKIRLAQPGAFAN